MFKNLLFIYYYLLYNLLLKVIIPPPLFAYTDNIQTINFFPRVVFPGISQKFVSR